MDAARYTSGTQPAAAAPWDARRQMVTAQIQQHGASIQSCCRCGKALRTKGYYKSTLRSVCGNVGVRVGRVIGCSCTGSQAHSFSTLFTHKNPVTPELRYLTAKMAALLPFGKVADFLDELLPLSAKLTACTGRNRTMRVGKLLHKSAEILATCLSDCLSEKSCKELVVGLDGGYVRNRHPRPERNFEIVAGKALDCAGKATRFACVRNGSFEAKRAVSLALQQCGVKETTPIMFLTDGDAGLRAIHHQVAPNVEHVLDWFHIAMKFTNLQQLAKGVNAATDGGIHSHALTELDRAKWRFWNGQFERGLICLVHLMLNGTLEDVFRHWHKAFRPIAETSQLAASA